MHVANVAIVKTIIISAFHELKIIRVAKCLKRCRTALHVPIYSLSQSAGAANTISGNCGLGLNFEVFSAESLRAR